MEINALECPQCHLIWNQCHYKPGDPRPKCAEKKTAPPIFEDPTTYVDPVTLKFHEDWLRRTDFAAFQKYMDDKVTMLNLINQHGAKGGE